MPNGKIKIEHRVTKLEACVESIKEDVGEIKYNVNNHIPTAIKELDRKIGDIKDTINKRPTWLFSVLLLILSFLLGLLSTHFLN